MKTKNQDLLIHGKVVGIHALRGEIKVISRSGTPESLIGQEEIFLREPHQQEIKRHTIRRARTHKRMTLISLEGISRAEEALRLVGNDVLVDRTKLSPLPAGEYYWFQIEGLRVVTLEHTYLGRIEQLIPSPANDVYVVRGGGKEILIPAVEEIVQHIDLNEGVMVVDLPEGLLETDLR
ncbi:MAG: 16S rRNA processing protein RimM [Deltaproteobacteria bacterium]|nr:16S rRNA processing protein RimM [Deltaproteobacteria bacterium]MBW2308408.1 16S rRNA processing protein RimM [Deltaproteobacteria bacterium]